MESLLRRRFWIIRLLGIATASALAGSAVSSVLALRIVDASSSFFGAGATVEDEEELDEDAEPEGPEVLANGPSPFQSPARTGIARKAAIDRLEHHNPFCPQCGPAAVAVPEGLDPTA